MSRRLQLVVVLMVLACTALMTLPTTARTPAAADLQMIASGQDVVTMSVAGCRKSIRDGCITDIHKACSACR
jgi:hypothetical protein